MNKKIILSFIFSIFSFALYIYNDYLLFKINETNMTNIKQRENITNLKEIKETNKWIKEDVKNEKVIWIQNTSESKVKMIDFFDKNKDKYNFKVKKFFYLESDESRMIISFKIIPENEEDIHNLFNLKLDKGILIFSSIQNKGKNIFGEITLIQKIGGENNVSQ